MTDQPFGTPGTPDPAAETTSTPAPDAAGSVPAAVPSAVPLIPVATEAPTPEGGAKQQGRRTRWAVAGGVVATVALLTGVAAYALTGASPNATVLGYAPADSVVYGEVRLDLPGDQRRALGEFLSKFPGFADQAALDTKLDEVLDRVVSEATEGKQTFTTDIKPWFGGEVAFAVGPLPSDLGAESEGGKDGRGVALISVKDAALAQAWFTDAIADAGATPTTQDYQGTPISVFDDAGGSDKQAAFAIVDGKVAVGGDLESVKSAIDTNGSSGLAQDPEFSAALGAADGDHIGFVYVDIRSVLDSVMALGASLGVDDDVPGGDALLGFVPDWASFRLRVEGDALVLDGAAPHVDGAPGADENRANAVASWAPPSTIVLAAGNDVGETLLETVETLRKDASLGEIFTQIDEAAGMLGGLESAVGWIGDAGVVVAESGDAVEGGLVIIPTDAAAGERLLTTLGSLATLGGGQVGITVRTEEHAGTTITIIDLGDLSGLAGMTEMFGRQSELPFDPGMLPKGDLEIAYAATDDVVVIGGGAEFVKHVLDAGAGQSLADESRYQGLVGRVGSEHTAVSFVDIAAIRGMLEGMLSNATAAERAEYEESVKPFLTPFDALVGASVRSGELNEQHGVITVK